MFKIIEEKSFQCKNRKRKKYLCECECGKQKWIDKESVLSKRSTNCGCKRTKILKEKNTKHGKTDHPLFSLWCNIKQRCYNKDNLGYKNYGGRGILLCNEWQNFTNFFNDNIDRWSQGLTIERIDVNGNYSPENTTFIPPKKQALNKTTTRWVVFEGAKIQLSELCKNKNISYGKTIKRLNKGFSIEEAIFLKTTRKNKDNPDTSKPTFWTIVEEKKIITNQNKTKTLVFCECICGVKKWVAKTSVTTKRSRSCGCQGSYKSLSKNLQYKITSEYRRNKQLAPN